MTTIEHTVTTPGPGEKRFRRLAARGAGPSTTRLLQRLGGRAAAHPEDAPDRP